LSKQLRAYDRRGPRRAFCRMYITNAPCEMDIGLVLDRSSEQFLDPLRHARAEIIVELYLRKRRYCPSHYIVLTPSAPNIAPCFRHRIVPPCMSALMIWETNIGGQFVRGGAGDIGDIVIWPDRAWRRLKPICAERHRAGERIARRRISREIRTNPRIIEMIRGGIRNGCGNRPAIPSSPRASCPQCSCAGGEG